MYIEVRDKVETIHEKPESFTLRISRHKYITPTQPNFGEPFRQRFIAWILGMPRSQRGTGYFDGRRASPLIFAVHQKYALSTMFISSDWPSQVEWRGRGKRSIKTTPILKDAYNALYYYFERYLRSVGITFSYIFP